MLFACFRAALNAASFVAALHFVVTSAIQQSPASHTLPTVRPLNLTRQSSMRGLGWMNSIFIAGSSLRQGAVLPRIGETLPTGIATAQNFAQSAINRRRLSNSEPRA